MYFRPALRAFSESTSPFHRPPSGSEKALQNCLPSGVVSIRQLHLPGSVIETGEHSHAISTGSSKCWRRARTALLSPFAHPSSVWTIMSLSSSSAAGIVQNSDSAVIPVPVEEALGANILESSREDVIIEYIVIRKDLVEGLNWPLGSVISQGCHAAVAAIWLHKEDPVTLQYCATENLDNMHKVTLEVKGEAQLRTLAQKLESGGIVHKLWIMHFLAARSRVCEHAWPQNLTPRLKWLHILRSLSYVNDSTPQSIFRFFSPTHF